jgi:D-gamma-glutamyl-meso-diaminopimelic acid endopeptidase CwlS
MRQFYSLLIVGMILASLSLAGSASAKTTCTSPYIVSSGDSLTGIAQSCGTTVDALMAANPQITYPSLIYPGESLTIPDSAVIPLTGVNVAVTLSAYSGQPGTVLTVSGVGFPASQALNVILNQPQTGVTSTTVVNSDPNGAFTTQVAIPSSAQAGSQWLIMAAAQSGTGSSARTQFLVVAQAPTGPYIVQAGDTLAGIAARYNITVRELLRANTQLSSTSVLTLGQQVYVPGSVATINGKEIYIVQPGEYMAEIARRFNITNAALLAANPGLSNPSLIYPGQRIVIPSSAVIPVTGNSPQLQLSPATIQPGTQVTVTGKGFPANAALVVFASQAGAAPGASASVTADSSGNFTAQLAIPATAQIGASWSVSAAVVTASQQFQIVAPTSTNSPTPGG